MRFLLKIVLFFVTVILLGSIIAPLIKLGFDLSTIICPSFKGVLNFELRKILTRVIMVFAVLGIAIFYNELGLKSFNKLGVSFNKASFFLFSKGFVLGSVSLVLLIAILVQFDLYRFGLRASYGVIGVSLAKYAVSAILIAIIEEIFFRGFILQTLNEKKSLFFSLVATNIFYSIVHFFRGENIKMESFDAFAGVRIIKSLFINIGINWQLMLPTFVGLFLVGLVLSYAYIRTGSLFLSIGLHAGWVFLIKSDGLFVDNTAKQLPGWLYDTSTVIGGVLSWGLVGFVALAIVFVTKKQYLPEENV